MKLWGVIDCVISCAMLWLSREIPKTWVTTLLIISALGLMLLGICVILESFA